jgi:eukaryotic-like serine/threonine-protein kinase
MALTLTLPRQLEPVVKTPFNETNAELSPDGRWLAYQSDETGRDEIYVTAFARAGGKHQISSEGGLQPLWARTGKELFYRSRDGSIMSVVVDGKTAWSAATPTKMFEGPYYYGGGSAANNLGRTYDVSPDGLRFLMIKLGAGSDQVVARRSMVVVQNWFEELKRIVPKN